MGSGGSSQQGRNTPTAASAGAATNIQLTPDVLERWAMLASAAGDSNLAAEKKGENGPGENQRNLKEGGTVASSQQPVVNFSQETNDESQRERSSAILVERGGGEHIINLSKVREFEDLLSCSKESLRDLTDELQNDRVILGVENDGRPTFETVGAWKVRQEKEEELRKNDKMWNDKLDALKEKYVDSVIQDAEEFFARAEKLKEDYAPPKIQSTCEGVQSKIAECYAANPNEVIKCRPLVVKFYSCVENLSAQMMSQPSNQS